MNSEASQLPANPVRRTAIDEQVAPAPINLVAYPNAAMSSTRLTCPVLWRKGQTVQDILRKIRVDGGQVDVLLNGHHLDPAWLHRIKPVPGTILEVRQMPAGGDGLRAVLTIAVIVASVVLAPYVAAPLAEATALTLSQATTIAQAGIGLLSPLAVNALTPPPAAPEHPA